MKLEVLTQKGDKHTDKVDANNAVFSIKPNQHSVYLSLKAEMTNLRQGSASTKNRSMVSGSGKKPWRQKGTGRARAGSLRNPARVHGGTAFGPKPHKFNLKVNKKVRHLARRSILSQKLAAGELVVVNSLSVDSHKTKEFNTLLRCLKLNDVKVTILASKIDENLFRSTRNLHKVALVPVKSVSVYELLNCKNILIDVDGINSLNEQLAN